MLLVVVCLVTLVLAGAARADVATIEAKVPKWNGYPAAVSLTFDDGSDDQLTFGADQLNRRGFRGTFYIAVSRMDHPLAFANDPIPDRIGEQLVPPRLKNKWELLHENIRKHGHEVGCHTLTHPSLNQVSLDQVKRQFDAWYERVKPGRPVSLAYPRGKYNEGVKNIARAKFVAAREVTSSCPQKSSQSDDKGIDWAAVRGCEYWAKQSRVDEYVRDAVQSNKWQVFIYHGLRSCAYGECTMAQRTIAMNEEQRAWWQAKGRPQQRNHQYSSAQHVNNTHVKVDGILNPVTGEFQPCQFGWGLADAAQFSSELDQLAQRRDRGEVWVAPLAEVAAYIKQASSITVRAFLSTDADNKPTIRCWVKRTREPQHPMPLAPYTVELPIPEPWRPEEFQQVQFHDEGSSEGAAATLRVGGRSLFVSLDLKSHPPVSFTVSAGNLHPSFGCDETTHVGVAGALASKPARPKHTVYVHFSKTGSTSLRQALIKVSSSLSSSFVDVGFVYPGSSGKIRSAIRGRSRVEQVVQGKFGACDSVPDRDSCVYFTLLREPVDRIISSYNFFCSKGAMQGRYWHNQFLHWEGSKCPGISLTDYAKMIGNIYVKEFSLAYACSPYWRGPGKLPFEEENAQRIEPSRQHLQQAIANVRAAQVTVLALNDTLPQQWDQLCASFGWNCPGITHHNTNSHAHNPTDAELASIRDTLALDIEFFNTVVSTSN